jgi:hypothetical protein
MGMILNLNFRARVVRMEAGLKFLGIMPVEYIAVDLGILEEPELIYLSQ